MPAVLTDYKLRSYELQPTDALQHLARPGHQRITAIGDRLKAGGSMNCRSFLMLFIGESMSLIGPRPERPELEEEL